MKFSSRKTLLSILSLFVFSIALQAQDLDDVSISGKITDSNGLAVAGASVTATETQTAVERTVTTDDEGRYRIIELKPGLYKLTASAAGFGAKERIDLQTLSGQNLQLDFQLAPADVQAQATVTVNDDDTPAVDTTRTVVGGTITELEVEEFPNSTRNPLELVLTLGGTAEESLSTRGLAEDRNVTPGTPPLEQGNFSLSGGTAYSNNITIDGLDNNDDFSSRDRFQPSLENVAEVQVISNQFSSEYGRASGGRINIRTRAGGNRFRGRAFMFFRDDNLNANSWYNNLRKFTETDTITFPDTNTRFNRPALTDYNPGFTFSGPVILPFGEGRSIYDGHDRTFFSIAYEYSNIIDTTFVDTFVPVGSNPRFSLPASNSPCPPDITCVDINSAPPTPILPYVVSLITPGVAHIFTARLDHKLTSNNDLTLGWQLGRKDNKRTRGITTQRLDDAIQARKSDTDAYNFTDNHVFGANAVNQFRMQYSVFEPSFETDSPFDPVVLIGYRNPATSGNQTLVAGNSTAAISGDSTGFPQNRKETRWQFLESLTYIAGSHTLKGGFDIQTVRSKALGLEDATGTFRFANILDFQNNRLSQYLQNFGTASDVHNTYWGVFVNDEMKALKNLTISYGLRYERETAVTDNNNFGPRFGLAWDPFAKGKGVIRVGAGIFYNRVLLRTVADSIQNINEGLIQFNSNIGTNVNDPRRGPILAAIANRFPNGFSSADDLRALIVVTCATVVTTFPCNANTGFDTNVTSTGNPLRSVEPDLKIPESYQFNVGFEREIGKDFVIEANYTWNKTVHLWRDSNPNAASLSLANSLLGTNYADWTEYLLNNPFQLSPTRRYTFFLGSPTDSVGHHANSQTGGNCGVTTANCFVNLLTTNSSGTLPLVSVPGQNNNATGNPIGIALAAISQFRPDPTVEETSLIGSQGNVRYQGLILEIRRRYRKLGFGFSSSIRAVYTLSSTKDDGLNNTSNAEINGDFGREWARNLQDRRHRIAISGIFETPPWMGKLRFSPIFRYGSSAPFNLGIGGSDRNLDDLGTDRVNFSGNLSDIVWREPGSPIPDALIPQFSLQPIGSRGGNLPRNAGRGPSFYTFDLSVTREWRFGERMRLRPVVEFDNILNAAVFNFGSEFIDFAGLGIIGVTPTPAQLAERQNFLVPTRTFRQREIRLGVRFDF